MADRRHHPLLRLGRLGTMRAPVGVVMHATPDICRRHRRRTCTRAPVAFTLAATLMVLGIIFRTCTSCFARMVAPFLLPD